MNISRRDFLKGAAAAILLGHAFPGPKIWADSVPNGFRNMGDSLKKVWEATTLKRRIFPETSVLNRILGIPQFVDGENFCVRHEIGRNPKAIADAPKTLLFFGHITDLHLIDEESPARTVAAEPYLEQMGVRSAFRPQEDLNPWVLSSMVKTLNKLTAQSKMDFLLNTGDSVDNCQENELLWFLSVLQGGEVDPDSGADEDPVPGPFNDANDSFVSEGFSHSVPYYNAIGNHDILLQGNVPPDIRELYNAIVKKYLEVMVIDDPFGHHSNAVITPWANPPDPATLKPGELVADSRRRPLKGKDFIQLHLQKQGKRPFLGFPASLAGREFGYYSVYPKSGLPVKMIVLDTALRVGTALGAIDKNQYDQFLIPELEKAKANQELVIVVSHHPSSDIKTLAETRSVMTQNYGKTEALRGMIEELVQEINARDEYISRANFEETLKAYPNVFLHIAGHKHSHKITPVGENGNGYWQVQTGALMEYPQQSRLFEIVYEGNGVGAIQTCVVDHESQPDSLADCARKIAYQDAHGSRGSEESREDRFTGKAQDRNAVLRFPIPPDIANKL